MEHKKRDWLGNRRSVMATLGASNHSSSERQADDYYATDPVCIDKLIAKYDIPRVICEPCCGEGHLSRRLEALGCKVYSSDLIDRGYGEVKDFFDMQSLPADCDCILTNPPFKHTTDMILHALDILPDGGKLILFLRTLALEGQERYNKIYSTTPPKHLFQFSARIVCAKNGDFEEAAGAQSYAFYVWEKGWQGKTTIDWL